MVTMGREVLVLRSGERNKAMPKITPVEKKLDRLIQTVKVEQALIGVKAAADTTDRELLEAVHTRLTRSIERLTRSIAQSVNAREVRRGTLRKDVDELTRLWELEPPPKFPCR